MYRREALFSGGIRGGGHNVREGYSSSHHINFGGSNHQQAASNYATNGILNSNESTVHNSKEGNDNRRMNLGESSTRPSTMDSSNKTCLYIPTHAPPQLDGTYYISTPIHTHTHPSIHHHTGAYHVHHQTIHPTTRSNALTTTSTIPHVDCTAITGQPTANQQHLMRRTASMVSSIGNGIAKSVDLSIPDWAQAQTVPPNVVSDNNQHQLTDHHRNAKALNANHTYNQTPHLHLMPSAGPGHYHYAPDSADLINTQIQNANPWRQTPRLCHNNRSNYVQAHHYH